MKNYLLAATICGLAAWVMIGSKWISNNYCQTSTTTLSESIAESKYLSISNDSFFNKKYIPNIQFQKGNANPSLLPETVLALEDLANLVNDRNKSLIITGGQQLNESAAKDNEMILANKRAESIANLIQHFGLAKERIVTKSQLFDENVAFDPLQFEISEKNIASKAIFNPLNIYFNPSKTVIKNLPNLKDYFTNLKAYLKNNPEAKLSITGHADTWEGKKNLKKLSRQRANSLRDYLLKEGIEAKYLQVNFNNAESPLSKEGSIKNRRVEFMIILP